MPQSVVFWEWNLCYRLLLVLLEEDQRATGRVGAEDGKIHATGEMAYPERQKMPAAHTMFPYLIKRCRKRVHSARIVISKLEIASTGCGCALVEKQKLSFVHFTLAEIPSNRKIEPPSTCLAGVAKWQTQGT